LHSLALACTLALTLPLHSFSSVVAYQKKSKQRKIDKLEKKRMELEKNEAPPLNKVVVIWYA
jgi:hypothetical protein